jgi:hypothetical protein
MSFPAGAIKLNTGRFSYNTGSAIGCRHANDNLANEKQLCLDKQGDGMSYETYIELRNEVYRK